MTKTESVSLLNILKDSFDKTYVADGVDSIDALLPENMPDNLTRISSFLGLPNRMLDKNKRQSITNLFYNFIGYQENVTDRQRLINNILRPFVIISNIFNTQFKFLTNIVKLVTELIPATAMFFFSDYIAKILNNIGDNNRNNKLVYALAATGFILNLIPYFACRYVYFAGYAITSPINSVREQIQKKSPFGVIISVAITFASYAILLPLAINAIVIPMLNTAIANAPAFFGNAINATINAVSPILSSIGNAFAPLASLVTNMATFNFYNFAPAISVLSPAALGLGGLAGLCVSTAGTVINHFVDKFNNWLHKPATPAKPVTQSHSAGESNSNKLIHENLLENKQKDTVENQVKVENSGSAVSVEKKDETPVKLSVVSTLYSRQEDSEKEMSKSQETISPSVKLASG